jgi:hypothetical protein
VVCTCSAGYHDDGIACQACKVCSPDATKTGSCEAGSTSDGVSCSCNEGFIGDGVTCTALTCGPGEYKDLASLTCKACTVCGTNAADMGTACDGTGTSDTVSCGCDAGARAGSCLRVGSQWGREEHTALPDSP